MFLENTLNFNKQSGWIEVVCGSMFSGKTEELIRRIRRAEFANLSVIIFKPRVDVRDQKNKVVSHDQSKINCLTLKCAKDILKEVADHKVVGVDEAQFFDNGIIKVCNDLANEGVRVIIAGLDMDYKGNPFGPMPNLMATAEYVTKVHAICAKSGNLANHSHRISTNKSLIHLGEKESYIPLSRAEFQKIKKIK